MNEPKEKPNYLDVKSEKYQATDVINVLQKLKERSENKVWHDLVLPSMGKCGYSKNAQICEITTNDEKVFIKELYSNKDKALTNLLSKCSRIVNDAGEVVHAKHLTNFDQTFLMIELSAITFPGPKTYETVVEDEKVALVVDRSELALTPVPDDLVYPMAIHLPDCDLTFHLKFITVEIMDRVEKIMREFKDDVMQRMFATISLITDRVTFSNGDMEIKVDTWMDYSRILTEIAPSDLKIITEYLNDNIIGKYGYKLVKTVYLPGSMKTVDVDLEPLNFFRISI